MMVIFKGQLRCWCDGLMNEISSYNWRSQFREIVIAHYYQSNHHFIDGCKFHFTFPWKITQQTHLSSSVMSSTTDALTVLETLLSLWFIKRHFKQSGRVYRLAKYLQPKLLESAMSEVWFLRNAYLITRETYKLQQLECPSRQHGNHLQEANKQWKWKGQKHNYRAFHCYYRCWTNYVGFLAAIAMLGWSSS